LIETICAAVQSLVNYELQKTTQALSMGKQCAFEDSTQLVPDRTFLLVAPAADVARHKDFSSDVTT
jgi:hypothetical protein